MISNLDWNIGRLIDALRNNGLEHTFIIFTSDNGGNYNFTRQLPLRAGKGSYYEGGIRVPLFFVWPDRISPGTRSEYPVTNLDFFPTLLAVAGADPRPELEGLNLLPLLAEGAEPAERALFWHFPIYLENRNAEAPTRDPAYRTRPVSVVRRGNWKLHLYYERNELELYNLAGDVGEQFNLAEFMPEISNRLLELLTAWRAETNAPIPTELNPHYVEPEVAKGGR